MSDIIKQVHPLDPKAAFQFMVDNPRSVLVDVRSSMEFLFVGHPKGAIHIPWMDEPDWVVNIRFGQQVRKLMLGGVCNGDGGHAPVVLICRSGRRSRDAGNLLLDQGFDEVYNIEQGFEGNLDDNHQRSTLDGWRYHGLPWEQC